MKKQNGVTLVTLVITIVLMLILTFTITVNIDDYKNQRIKRSFESDIEKLEEEIEQFYVREKKLPVINEYGNISMLEETKNVNDGDKYYVIDIRYLEVKLNYGFDFNTIVANENENEKITEQSLTDVYIINEQSHTIYYPKGLTYDGETHYRLQEVYSKIN